MSAGYDDDVGTAVAHRRVHVRWDPHPREKRTLRRGRPPHVPVAPRRRLVVGGLRRIAPSADTWHVPGCALSDPARRDDLAVTPGPLAQVEEPEPGHVARA